MYDLDLAGSITLTGQNVIKKAQDIIMDLFNDIGKCQFEKNDIVIAGDTDSGFFSFKPLITKLGIEFVKKDKVTKEGYELVDRIDKELNAAIKKWGETDLNSKDCRFEFKREKICDKALFLNSKKRYVLHYLDSEGVAKPGWKYTGVEVVNTKMPKAIKPHVKGIIETMILTGDQAKTNKVVNDVYAIFEKLPIEDISIVMGIATYNKYAMQCNGLSVVKRMPIGVKSAYYYNYLLEKYNLVGDYEPLRSGDKVRFVYAKSPNKYDINVVGYKYKFPEQFKADIKPNIEMMFDKLVFSMVERFYESVNWVAKKPGEQTQTDLFSLLK